MPDDLAGFVDTLALDPVILLGRGMGGAVALRYTVEHPERVARLILVNVGLPRVTVTRSVADVPTPQPDLGSFLARLGLPAEASQSPAVLEVFASLHPTHEHPPPPSWTEFVERARRTAADTCARVMRVSCPTLVLRDERSERCSAEDANALTKALPHATQATIPAADEVSTDDSAGVLAVVGPFLGLSAR